MASRSFYQRRAGILLHPTSLPSRVLDGDVERWLDMMANTGFSVWQMLPLGEPQGGLSPYQCISAFAVNPALLHDYPEIEHESQDFTDFCNEQEWLDDYVLFKVLKHKFDNASWCDWPDNYKYRHSHALLQLAKQYSGEIDLLKWQQYQLHLRWQHIKNYANDRNVLLFGDMPLFVAHDSVDVWAAPERFLLDKTGNMKVVTGVPPDYFSSTGQRWGNPHYDLDFMCNEQCAWWLARFKQQFTMFDMIRIDHFRGMESAWVIDAACETAIDGHWKKMPGDELLARVQQLTGYLPIVAEDLGIITSEVKVLRKKFQLPGMAVLQFGFDEHEDNPHKVRNIEEDCVVYTGTHDNDTTRGWFESLDIHARQYVINTLTIEQGKDSSCHIVDVLIDKAMSSKASLCMLPMQDILCLDTSARMNIPGTSNGNWNWSFSWIQLENNMTDNMSRHIRNSNRLVTEHV